MTRLIPDDPVEQLTKHQVRVLKTLANSVGKVYCAPAGTKADRRQNEINVDFNAILRLVELGLMSDLSDSPMYRPLVKKYADEEGREVAIVALNKVGDEMFRRTPWGKWVN
jgi:hypothetical protein